MADLFDTYLKGAVVILNEVKDLLTTSVCGRSFPFDKLRVRMTKIIVVALLTVFAGFAFAPSAAHAQQSIKSIDIQGNTITADDSVVAMIRSRPGTEYSKDRVNEDVKDLFNSGRFSDVWVDRNPSVGGIELIFHVVERPIIGKISFQGNKKIKVKALEKDMPVEKYAQLNPTQLTEAIEKIKEKYEKKDFNLVDVTYQLKTMDDGNAELIFIIKENEKTFINKVSFIGNKVFSDSKLRKIIKSKKKGALSFITNTGKMREELLEADIALLNRFYLEHGYLRANISAPKVEVTKDKKYLYITYRVEEGKQYRVKSVKVAGDILTTPEELTAMMKMKAGEIYNQLTVEADMDALTLKYGNDGYAFANIRPIPEINDDDETVDLVYYVEKGNRIRIEKIEITGNTTTRDKVIRRELKVKENDIYNEEAVRFSKLKLSQLGYFETVDFSTPRGSQNDTLILKINVKEKPTGSFNIGAGFSTVDHFIFSASVSKQNFFGYGWSGTISAELSRIRQMFYLQMTDPYFLDSQWMLSFSGYKTVYKFQDFSRDSFGGGTSLGRRFFDFSSLSIGYTYEDVSVTDFSSIVPQIFRQNASGRTSQVNLSLARDTRDNRITTTKGTYLNANTEYSGSKLGGTNDYFRTSGVARFYYPIKWGVVGKANASIGYIKSLNNMAVPLFERYFTGGVNSLRGYYPLSVGPKMRIPGGPAAPDQEFTYGGNKELVFNVEFEIPLYAPGGFKAVAFFDAGNAYGEDQNYSLTNILCDYGFGLRWNSPMGPLRFEWGIPINKRPGDDDVVFNFTIGSFF